MSGTEKTKEALTRFSHENIDTLVKTSSFKEELEEVRCGSFKQCFEDDMLNMFL